MATAVDFVERINQIEGVSGCVLVKDDGTLLGNTLGDTEDYSGLLQVTSGLSADIMNNVGFSYCRYICFNRDNMQNFYVFPIANYLLGIVQQTDCSVARMLDKVYHLVSRVSTGGAGSHS
ncbi:hypothetical protein SAMN05660420_01029 [Desulfuromusa kysingii]|uniref:Roadblock/LAMTOR2 domain-containing protein n=1 Tax=Desulfuromusa kysingii TaxID=37625 RepID=A0A1H3XLS9_9BACT|nr:roadblock/LC7 domain-containing protein [Desulfuromusa kysingii]SEA00293.1 hypothetical protein SAMN05660420_01029 [Desulfuromusa kysingii]